MKIELYEEMNEKIADLIAIDGTNADLYASAYIKALQKENARLKSELVDGRGCEIKYCKNITENNHADEFICSKCGFQMEDFSEVRIDEDDDEKTYHEFEMRYCPNCGAKVLEEDNG